MSITKTTHTFTLGDAEIHLETGQVAKQAGGSLVVRHLKSWVLATVVADAEPRPGIGFFPLTVEYRERLAAGARIPGAFGRREGRIAEHEVLASRIIDRSLRPLFPDGFRCETQVQVTVFSADEASDLEVLGMIAAFGAVHLSDLPFDGPVGGVRVARVGGTLQAMASEADRKKADLDIIVSASRDGLVMVEGLADMVTDATVLDAIDTAAGHIDTILGALDTLREQVGAPKRAFSPPSIDTALLEEVSDACMVKLLTALETNHKQERRAAMAAVHAEALALAGDGDDAAERRARLEQVYDQLLHDVMRDRIVDGWRIGDRPHDGVRAIDVEVGLLQACHGSSLFTRGETQALVAATLGGNRDARDYDTAFGRRAEQFFLHYTFPPYSVGETRPLRGPGRREIGHGNLARRALLATLPSQDEYPYTIRVTSDITESNGSSSMATVCGGCLALYDAGVPVKAPVAGIAMGLIKKGDRIVILSDILGDEDHLGDMDFKVAGTVDRVTAVQLDNKLGALPREVLEKALAQAQAGRAHILGVMQPAIDRARAEGGSTATHMVKVSPNKVGKIIGKGGATIQGLQADTGTRIDIKDDGRVFIIGADPDAVARAAKKIDALVADLVNGGLYLGQVMDIKDFGVFVRIGEHEALVHISELDKSRVGHPSDVTSKGETMLVKVLGTDDRGRLKLSRKAALGASPSEALNA